MSVSVRMSFKVDPSESCKISVNIIAGVNEYQHEFKHESE